MGTRSLGLLVLIFFLCLGLMSCSTRSSGNYGRITPDAGVTKIVEAYLVNPDYRYYISGVDLNPNAFMGLHRDYRLEPSTLWREVESPAASMKEIVDGMRRKAQDLLMLQYGFNITDSDGKSIGIWYSILDAKTFVRVTEEGTVRIDTPAQDTYERRERDGRSYGEPFIPEI